MRAAEQLCPQTQGTSEPWPDSFLCHLGCMLLLYHENSHQCQQHCLLSCAGNGYLVVIPGECQSIMGFAVHPLPLPINEQAVGQRHTAAGQDISVPKTSN